MQFDPSTGLDEKLSDYVGRIDFSPTDFLDVRYRFRLDQNDLTYVRNELGVGLGLPRGRVDLGYLMLEDDPALQSLREREEVTAVGRTSRLLPIRSRSRARADTTWPPTATCPGRSSAWSILTPACSSGSASSGATPRTPDAEDTPRSSFRVAFKHLGDLARTADMLGVRESADREDLRDARRC